MKLLNWKMLWILLWILLLITACPDATKPEPNQASFTLNLTEAAPGAIVIAKLKNMRATGATVTVAQKNAAIVSISADSINFKIPDVGHNEIGQQKVIISSAGKTAEASIKIIHSKFSLDRGRASRGEKITGTVRAIDLEGAKLSIADEAVSIIILSKTKFTFVIPNSAPTDIQQVRLEPKNGKILTEGIEILGKVINNKVSIIINPAKVVQAKALLLQLGFTLTNELKDLGNSGACSGEYAEIDIGGIPLGQALERLKALEEDGTLLHIDPVTEWDTGSVDHIGAIGANTAHERNIYGTGIMIAILDTGVSSHHELGSRLRTNLGYNFVGNNTNTKDDFDDPSTSDYNLDGHGTPIAILAAGTEFGVAPEAEIMPIKVCDKNGACLSSNVILGVCHALEKAPDRKKLVLNLSLGGDTKVRALEAILRYALDEGVLVAAAAGNQGLDGSPTHYPAAFFLEGLVAVGALKPENSYWVPSDFSTRGKYLDIAAPGEFLESGSPNGTSAPNYKNYRGTSFATPLVAGALALWRDVNPNMSPADIEQGLKDSATDLTKVGCSTQVCTAEAVGAGLLNLNIQPKKP